MLRLAMPGTLLIVRLPPSPLLTTAPLPLLAVLAVRLRAKPATPMLRVHPSPPLEALPGLLNTTRAISSPMAPLPPRAALADPQRAMLTLLGTPRTLNKAALAGPLTLRLVAVTSGGTPRATRWLGLPKPWSGDIKYLPL